MFYHGLHISLHLCFAVIRSVSQINLSVHLPACPPFPIHLHALTPTHSVFFFSFPISNEMRRSLVRGSPRPLIPNISLLCLHLKRVVGGWQRGNSLRDWGDAREALRRFSFQVLPHQPIRSYIYYS